MWISQNEREWLSIHHGHSADEKLCGVLRTSLGEIVEPPDMFLLHNLFVFCCARLDVMQCWKDAFKRLNETLVSNGE